MTLLENLKGRLRLPLIGSPLFIISVPDLVVAQCTSGVIGSMPSLNARPVEQLDAWLAEIKERLAAHDAAHPDRPAAPFAINLIVHRSNDRLEQDLALCVKHKVPLIITSLGARPEVNQAIHAYGGYVIHDVINQTFAHKAIEKGADGLVLVAAGAGGHAGAQSPFAMLQETRAWFDGPIALSGAMAHGRSILAAEAMGADFAYMGTAFIATQEARAVEDYKAMIVGSGAEDIIYTNLITGVHGNYLKPSLRAAGLDPDNLAGVEGSTMNFGTDRKRKWKDIWGAGQSVSGLKEVVPAAALIDRLAAEYAAARARINAGSPLVNPAWGRRAAA
ncbi:nitronate monooxygenase family protein [Roseomonas sp. HJA6]|uniref:Nitronate monooxygenase family protein n=1 Tax=Roseomonas alba TaxID=2846776 RepID=A0ABS7A618_9PROT|nr:nitronate monooxygenase family protein [Neoroseomonas alba]MBW6397749.1 nitronate monooxygenase family protein [Neoroseomonas alba]